MDRRRRVVPADAEPGPVTRLAARSPSVPSAAALVATAVTWGLVVLAVAPIITELEASAG